MIYTRIESALTVCEEHIAKLDPTDLAEKELETYIVSGLILLIVSEYEEHLESLFIRRAEACGDSSACNYIKLTLNQKFRSPDLSKIHQTLKNFDDAYLSNFKQEIENSPKHAAWDSVMKARHAVVHKKGQLNMTFRELKNIYPLTKEIIKKLSRHSAYMDSKNKITQLPPKYLQTVKGI